MKHYKDHSGAIFAFEEDGTQDALISTEMTYITDAELAAFRASAITATPLVVTMRQARLALLRAGLLASVDAAVAARSDAARIEWEYAAIVDRNSPLVASLSAALAMTQAQLDSLFTEASKL